MIQLNSINIVQIELQRSRIFYCALALVNYADTRNMSRITNSEFCDAVL